MAVKSPELKGVTLLGKYLIERPLGEGGMGSVWLGTHIHMGRKVAIKMLDESLREHPEVVERFGREARAASAIQHPGIVEVLDLDQTDDGRPFLVMELLEGESLAGRIERKTRLAVDEAVMIIAQLLEALEAAHKHGVIHRDLKPDNIFLVPRGRGGELVKILDFGISHKADERVSKLTVQGTVLGTPHYMAPEQARGDAQVDARTDVYAVGVVFYECIVGDVPFDAPNYNALLHRILMEQPEPPSARGIEIDPRIESLLLRALSKRREQRPPSAEAFLSELKAAFAPSPPEQDEAGDRSPVSPDTLSDQLKPADASAVPSLSLDLPDDLPRDLPPAPSSATLMVAPASTAAAAPSSGSDLSLDPEFGLGDQGDVAAPQLNVVAEAPPKGRVVPWQLKAVLVVVLGIGLVVGALMAVRTVLEASAPPPVPRRAVTESEEERPAPITNIEVELRGVPARAQIKLDGFPPATLPFRVKPGTKHTVEIAVDGYEPWSRDFEAAPGVSPLIVDVELRPQIGGP